MSVPTLNQLPFGLPGLVDASPQTLGWVYTGDEQMTDNDEKALNDYMMSMGYPGDQKIDPFSKPGRHARRYTTYGNQIEGTQPKGGLGSQRYQQQLTDPLHNGGVNFVAPGDRIWYVDSETGESLKGFPPNCGAFHTVDVGGGYSDYYSGPRPGSVSEEILGDGIYVWSDQHQWYDVAKVAPE